jgi:phosphate transport system permease protein
MTTLSAPSPTRPWKASPKDRIRDLALFLFAILGTYFVVAVTPMKGKLAYFGLFFIFYMSITSGFQLFTRGSAAAKDAFVNSLVAIGAVVTVIPIASPCNPAFVTFFTTFVLVAAMSISLCLFFLLLN